MLFRRRNLLVLLVVEVVLFVLAGVTSKNSSHPGTVSNAFWTCSWSVSWFCSCS